VRGPAGSGRHHARSRQQQQRRQQQQQHDQWPAWQGSGGYGGLGQRWLEWQPPLLPWAQQEPARCWDDTWAGSFGGGSIEPGWDGGGWGAAHRGAAIDRDWRGYAEDGPAWPLLPAEEQRQALRDRPAPGLDHPSPVAVGPVVRQELPADGCGACATNGSSSSSKAPARGDKATAAGCEQAPFQDSRTGRLPSRTGRQHGHRPRLWCHIFLHKGHAGFDLVPIFIGRGGCNMRHIYSETRAKIRVRGRGSGHLEVDGRREAPVPLMVAVTANSSDEDGFKLAIQLTLKRLKAVEDQYHIYCQVRNLPVSPQTLFSVGELSKGAELLLGDALRDADFANKQVLSTKGGTGAYEDLAACLCNTPWASARVRCAVMEAALGAAVRAEVPFEEAAEVSQGTSGADEDEEQELPDLISSQVSAFLRADPS